MKKNKLLIVSLGLFLLSVFAIQDISASSSSEAKTLGLPVYPGLFVNVYWDQSCQFKIKTTTEGEIPYIIGAQSYNVVGADFCIKIK
jgi:hypothetical protein